MPQPGLSFSGSNTLPRARPSKQPGESSGPAPAGDTDSEIVITKSAVTEAVGASSVRIRIGGSARSPTQPGPGPATSQATAAAAGGKIPRSSELQQRLGECL